MAKDAATVAKKWANNLSQATTSMTDGVNAVTQAPTAAAALRAQAYVQGVQNAVNSGSWQAALNAVSLQDWKNAMTQKGIPRVASGATQAIPKMQSFLNKLLPYQANLKQQLASTPRGDKSQNMQRMIAWFDGMSNFSKNQ